LEGPALRFPVDGTESSQRTESSGSVGAPGWWHKTAKVKAKGQVGTSQNLLWMLFTEEVNSGVPETPKLLNWSGTGALIHSITHKKMARESVVQLL
jgi:hypothetical protein